MLFHGERSKTPLNSISVCGRFYVRCRPLPSCRCVPACRFVLRALHLANFCSIKTKLNTLGFYLVVTTCGHGKCDKNIDNDQDRITCVDCKSLIHIACVQIRSAKLPTVKNTWKCDQCLSDTGSTLVENENDQGSNMSAVLQGVLSLWKDSDCQQQRGCIG